MHFLEQFDIFIIVHQEYRGDRLQGQALYHIREFKVLSSTHTLNHPVQAGARHPRLVLQVHVV